MKDDFQKLTLGLPPGKKFYFAGDFHLGAPAGDSREREKRVVRWLQTTEADGAALFLLGDVFDFWFEYKRAVPKGFVRFQGELARLTDKGVPVFLFTGNHDMWMYDYFPAELGVRVFHHPVEIQVGETLFLVGHGDGLGPGDHKYKLLKKVFKNKINQRLFGMLHPNLGIKLAHAWSRKSRLANNVKESQEDFDPDKEFLLAYCRQQEQIRHHDYYIFGHRHLLLDLEVAPSSRYLNPGDWVNHSHYIVYDGQTCRIENFAG